MTTALAADSVGGSPSCATLSQLSAQLDPEVRQQVVKGWLAAARAEHASVASFNRFSMQLLAVGAPADLLEAAQRAALDEIRHTRLCFSIASSYAGQPLGPGPLPMGEGIYSGFDLRALACGTVEEGCIGETLAAMEAAAAREPAEPSMVRRALEVIERDESSHAALAFKTVRWALTQQPALREPVERCYLATLARHLNEARGEHLSESDLARHGLLPEPQRQQLRQQTIDAVLRPALTQLLQS